MWLIASYGLIFFLLLFFFGNQSLLNLGRVPRKIYYGLFTLCEFSFFTSFLWYNISKKAIRLIIKYSSLFFVCFQIFYFFATINYKRTFDSIPIGVESVLLFTFILLFFYDFFITTKDDYIYNNYCFWIAIGIMLYLGSSFFIYILANHISEQQRDYFWIITYIAEILKNIFFAVALFVFDRSKREKITNKNIPYLDFN